MMIILNYYHLAGRAKKHFDKQEMIRNYNLGIICPLYLLKMQYIYICRY